MSACSSSLLIHVISSDNIMPTPDWSAVLSKCRNDQVARVALLVPNEALVRKENISSNTHRKPIEPEHDAITDDTDDSHNMESESIYNSDDETDGWGHEEHATILSTGHHQRIEPDDSNKAHAEKLNHLLDLSQQIIFNNLKINNFVYEEGTKGDPSWPKVVQSTNLFYQGLGKSGLLSNTSLPSTFHAIEWASWENDISWELPHNVPMRTIADESSPSLLTKPINNILENLNISSIIDWERNDGNKIDVLEKLSSCIILEHGVVGRSICHISGAIPTNFRPDPFHQSDVFERRMERELAAKSTAGGAASLGSSLQTDVVQLERIIADRQKRRAQMAIDKTNRVTDAMKTLAIGAGTGRTITSSLMGPGGTERTGRPNRDIASSAYDNEYIEQLDVVYKHIWIKAGFRLSELRFFHRPRLPRYMFESATVAPWQCQVRISHNSKSFDNRKWKDQRADGSTLVTSYQSQFMGHGGAHHQSRYRNEADLSPTEGLLILLEYSEERPPIQMLKGMASKIINYYRGDRAKCPISAGGGDRPITKKKNSIHEDQKGDKFSFDSSSGYGRLIGPSDGVDDIATIIGRSGGRKNSNADLYAVSSKDKDRQNILPEGVTELLHSKTHGPFIGTIEEGATQTGLISNLFAAPMFMHEARSTDFLLTLGKRSISKNGTNEIYRYGAILRPMPTSVFVVGQIEPRVKVYAPNSVSEKNFLANFVTFHIAKALHRCQSKDQQGLFFDDLIGRFFSDSSVPINIFRQRMKQVADYDKNTQLWTLKEAGSEDFPGLDVLGRRFSPEGVAAYESCCSAVQRLVDIGLREVFTSANCLSNFSIAIQHLSGLIHSARERKSRMNKIISRSNLKKKAMLIYEMALKTLESEWKEIKKKGEIARFIYEELQLSPWNLTSDFIDVHKNSQGSGMIKLTGFGDPSGRGEGFNFIREDTKAHRTSAMAAAEGALKEQIKKITGTDNDLRKLNMKEMAQILRSYGLSQEKIDKLKRWDRVHVIRDLSTKNASDGLGDGLERYARGERLKLTDQKRMYTERLQEIWRRQQSALTSVPNIYDISRGMQNSSDSIEPDTFGDIESKTNDATKDNEPGSDFDSEDEDDDDIAADLEDEFMDISETKETNMLIKGQLQLKTEKNRLDLNTTSHDLAKDAREYAALRRQHQEDLASHQAPDVAQVAVSNQRSTTNMKVIRRRVTKTFPDGSQTVFFKFIVDQGEVDKIILCQRDSDKKDKDILTHNSTLFGKKKALLKQQSFSHVKGGNHDKHKLSNFFDDDEEAVGLGRGRSHTVKRRSRKSVEKGSASVSPGIPESKDRTSSRMSSDGIDNQKKKKRKRNEDDSDEDDLVSYPRGTSNRRERGSLRERMPHVILADRLELIRQEVEKRPHSVPFHRPVNRRSLPGYYEVISEPIDLQTIRDKNKRYEYKTASAFLADFELMKNNAVKFNGMNSTLANEATAIVEMVTKNIELDREELEMMEEAVREQLTGSSSGKKKN